LAAAHVDTPFDFRIRESDKLSDPLLVLSDGIIGYGAAPVLADVQLTLHPGARIGLLGANGAGKSTLIKAMTGDLALRGGQRTAGMHLAIGYYAQQQLEALDLEASALTHIRRLSPAVSEQEIRNFLGGFDFHDDAALTPIRPMSGGEKARLALALIAWQKPNLLLLDEPTNHLDLEMRHALTMALQAFNGALVVVSHDRHLLRHSVDEFLLVADGRVEPFDGDLEDYHRLLTTREQRASRAPPKASAPPRGAREQKATRQAAAARRAEISPLRKAVEKIERQMDETRAGLAELENRLADETLYGAGAKDALQAVLKERGSLEQCLARQEEAWLEAQTQLDDLARELGVEA
ncbi:MAG TPA: ATP-binding cassette domain-containing protein, partial [Gammaproteobacteria bacterium]|nr:ATP-binding cassette domain-containing protein [Gammaproteobacteria bacterium]